MPALTRGLMSNPPSVPEGKAKLRLMYEANPMSYLIEQAGGASSDGFQPIMDVPATSLHQRVGVVLGDPEEVATIAEYGRTG